MPIVSYYPPLAKEIITTNESINPGINKTINIKNWSLVIAKFLFKVFSTILKDKLGKES